MTDLPVPEAGPEEVRRLADRVLADEVFDRAEPGLVVQARDWIFEQVGEALDRLLAAAGGGPLGWVIVGILALAAVVLAVRFTRGVQGDPDDGGTPAGPRRPATDWLADAERLEAAGEWRASLRCRHRALVAALAARGIVEEVPGRTAAEYRAAAVGVVPAVAPDLAGATDLFEGAWYGRRLVDAEDARRFRDLSERVLTAAGARS